MTRYTITVDEEGDEMLCHFSIETDEDDWGHKSTWFDFQRAEIDGQDVSYALSEGRRRELERMAYADMRAEYAETIISRGM